MADPPPQPIPQIGPAYWFGYSKQLVDGALKARDEVADKLQTYIGWLWTVYTASAVIGVNLRKPSLGLWPTIVIGSPIIALVMVYWLTIWTRMPVLMGFDPRAPADIQMVYEYNLLHKQRRLRITLGAAAVAAALIACAVGTVSSIAALSASPLIDCHLTSSSEANYAMIHAVIPRARKASVTVYPYDRNSKTRGTPLATEEAEVPDGQFRPAPIALKGGTSITTLIQIEATLDDQSTIVLSQTLTASEHPG